MWSGSGFIKAKWRPVWSVNYCHAGGAEEVLPPTPTPAPFLGRTHVDHHAFFSRQLHSWPKTSSKFWFVCFLHNHTSTHLTARWDFVFWVLLQSLTFKWELEEASLVQSPVQSVLFNPKRLLSLKWIPVYGLYFRVYFQIQLRDLILTFNLAANIKIMHSSVINIIAIPCMIPSALFHFKSSSSFVFMKR